MFMKSSLSPFKRIIFLSFILFTIFAGNESGCKCENESNLSSSHSSQGSSGGRKSGSSASSPGGHHNTSSPENSLQPFRQLPSSQKKLFDLSSSKINLTRATNVVVVNPNSIDSQGSSLTERVGSSVSGTSKKLNFASKPLSPNHKVQNNLQSQRIPIPSQADLIQCAFLKLFKTNADKELINWIITEYKSGAQELFDLLRKKSTELLIKTIIAKIAEDFKSDLKISSFSSYLMPYRILFSQVKKVKGDKEYNSIRSQYENCKEYSPESLIIGAIDVIEEVSKNLLPKFLSDRKNESGNALMEGLIKKVRLTLEKEDHFISLIKALIEEGEAVNNDSDGYSTDKQVKSTLEEDSEGDFFSSVLEEALKREHIIFNISSNGVSRKLIKWVIEVLYEEQTTSDHSENLLKNLEEVKVLIGIVIEFIALDMSEEEEDETTQYSTYEELFKEMNEKILEEHYKIAWEKCKSYTNEVEGEEIQEGRLFINAMNVINAIRESEKNGNEFSIKIEELVANIKKFILQKNKYELEEWMSNAWNKFSTLMPKSPQIIQIPENTNKDLLIKVIFEHMKAVAATNIEKQVCSNINVFEEEHCEFYITIFNQVNGQLYKNNKTSMVMDLIKAIDAMPQGKKQRQEIQTMTVNDLVKKLEDNIKKSFSKEILKKWIDEVYTAFCRKSKLLQDIKLPLDTDKDLLIKVIFENMKNRIHFKRGDDSFYESLFQEVNRQLYGKRKNMISDVRSVINPELQETCQLKKRNKKTEEINELVKALKSSIKKSFTKDISQGNSHYEGANSSKISEVIGLSSFFKNLEIELVLKKDLDEEQNKEHIVFDISLDKFNKKLIRWVIKVLHKKETFLDHFEDLKNLKEVEALIEIVVELMARTISEKCENNNDSIYEKLFSKINQIIKRKYYETALKKYKAYDEVEGGKIQGGKLLINAIDVIGAIKEGGKNGNEFSLRVKKLVTNIEKFILQKHKYKLKEWMKNVWGNFSTLTKESTEVIPLPKNVNKGLVIKVILEDMKNRIPFDKSYDFYKSLFQEINRQLYKENDEKGFIKDVRKFIGYLEEDQIKKIHQ